MLKNLLSKITGIGKTVWSAIKKAGGAVWGFVKKHKIISIIIALALAAAIFFLVKSLASKQEAVTSMDITVERRNIEESISDSTVVEPNSEYSISAAVSGEILADYFEEGDTVQKDDVLYTIDSETLQNSIESAEIAVQKAKQSYDDAVNENNVTVRDYTSSELSIASAENSLEKAKQTYQEAVEGRDDLQLTSNCTGVVTEVYVSAGDNVSAGTKIADVTDNSRLKIKVPFNSADADNIQSGEAATLTLSSSGSTISGVVTSVSPLTESAGGYTSYRNVTIEVDNPGGIAVGDSASAMVGEIACGDLGTFEKITDKSITASASGEIATLLIDEDSTVSEGELIAVLDSEDTDSQINSAKLSLDDAYNSLEKAKLEKTSSDANTSLSDRKLATAVDSAKMQYDDALLSLEKLEKELEDYSIKAPISGTVVTKNMKTGDIVGSGGSSATSSYSSSSSSSTTSSSSSSSAMAIIYDMSKLKCTLDVDEVDVKNVAVGQKVTITTDVNDTEYTGEVETVSVNGTAGTNGVTTYPVTINILDFDDDLLPGMNIDVSIIITSAENVLAIPSSTLNRGNTVYVKGEKTDENDNAPDGYKTVSVVTGAADDEYVEIVSGLSDGDVIYQAVQQLTESSSDTEQQEGMTGMGGMGGMSGGGMGGMSGGGGGGGGMPGGGGGGGGMR